MDDREKINTEEKILEAAKEVFVKEGHSGARMQEIADKAGINKSLLHYYYRSKDKLFSTVFKYAFSKLAPKIFDIFDSDKDIFVKIETFIENYLKILTKNPFIPMFILNELAKKGNNIAVTIFKNSDLNIDNYEKMILNEVKAGTIKKTNPKNLMINILSLCIFPIIGRPLIEEIVFKGSESDYEKYLSERKDEIFKIIKTTLTN